MKIFDGWVRGRNDKRFLKWCTKIKKIVIVGHKCMFKFFKKRFYVWWAYIVHVRVKNIIKNRGSIMSKNGNIMYIFVQNEEGDKGWWVDDKRFLKWCAKIQKNVIEGHKCMFKFFKRRFYVWWANIDHLSLSKTEVGVCPRMEISCTFLFRTRRDKGYAIT